MRYTADLESENAKLKERDEEKCNEYGHWRRGKHFVGRRRFNQVSRETQVQVKRENGGGEDEKNRDFSAVALYS